jgi:hypothetical protein
MDYSSFFELVDKYYEAGYYDPGIMAFNLIDLSKLKEKYLDQFYSWILQRKNQTNYLKTM